MFSVDHRTRRFQRSGIAALILMCVASTAPAADYTMTRHVIAAGGTTSATSASYSHQASIGQHDAGVMEGSTYKISGGFFPGLHSTTSSAAPLAACPNDFELASDGTGGERLSRFGCFAAPSPPATAGSGATAIRVVFRTLYNTSESDPDGASVCADRSLLATPQPSLSQFAGQTRWLGPPLEVVDDAAPTPPNYIAALLVCTGAEAEVRDWSPAGLAASFGGDADATRIYFYGSGVVPCSVYEVSQCDDPLDEATCSEPVLIHTGRMADAWPPFDVTGQPNFGDINALVNKYKGIPFSPGATPQGGPPEWHALQAGNVLPLPGQLASFLDISLGVDGYRGFPYREQGPCDGDTGFDNCGNTCTAP